MSDIDFDKLAKMCVEDLNNLTEIPKEDILHTYFAQCFQLGVDHGWWVEREKDMEEYE